MNNPLHDMAQRMMQGIADAGESEHRVSEYLKARRHITGNANRRFDDGLTFGQRVADRVAKFGGSWTFILIFIAILAAWIALNSLVLVRQGDAFDPYPYILLNLVLSMTAALQAPVIMMSQNRQSAKDRLSAEQDYEVNLKSELEIMALHQKFDTLREQQWSELVAMQQEQIRLLTLLLEDRTVRP